LLEYLETHAKLHGSAHHRAGARPAKQQPGTTGTEALGDAGAAPTTGAGHFEQVIAAAPLLCACWTKRFLWPADLLIVYPKEGWFVMGPQSQFA